MNIAQSIEEGFPIAMQIATGGHLAQILKDAHAVYVDGGPLFDASTRADPKKLSVAIAAMAKDGRLARVESSAVDMLQALGPILANPDNVAHLLALVNSASTK